MLTHPLHLTTPSSFCLLPHLHPKPPHPSLCLPCLFSVSSSLSLPCTLFAPTYFALRHLPLPSLPVIINIDPQLPFCLDSLNLFSPLYRFSPTNVSYPHFDRIAGIYLQILYRIVVRDITSFSIIFAIFWFMFSGSFYLILAGDRWIAPDGQEGTALEINPDTAGWGPP